MADLVSIFGGSFVPPAPKTPDSPEQQLIDAIAEHMTPPTTIVMDGKIRRFSPTGKNGDDAGWYLAWGDGVPAGSFGNWRDGVAINWTADVGREMTMAEKMANANRMREAQKARQEALEAKRDTVADTVLTIWENGAPASPDHPYLARKGVQPHGTRVTGDGRLMCPLFDMDGNLRSLQYISADGGKLYHSGGETGGMSYQIGTGLGPIYICEGFATAATVEKLTGERVFAAYSASGLVSVTSQLRERFPHGDLVVVADHDVSGTGQKYAEQAAAKYGCRIIMPPIIGDMNDYVQAGHDAVALFAPPENDWLVPADEWASQPAPIRWLVKGWLQRDGLSMVFGPSGGGKTFCVLDWCLHIASGFTEWRGCKVSAGGVVYMAGEGHHGLRARVAAWKQHHKPEGPMRMWLSKSGCDLNTPQGYNQARGAIMALHEKPSLIVVDTLHRFLAGDENSAVDTKQMLDACSGLMAEFGCSVLLVHHTGVSDEAQHRARGSSAWRGALENQIAIMPGKAIEIVAKKMKDSEPPESLFCELQSVKIEGWLDEDGEAVTSVVPVEAEAVVTEKRDGTTAKHMKQFRGAWAVTGYETDGQGRPFVSRSGLMRYMVQHMGLTEAGAKKAMQPSSEDRMIGYLLTAEIITTEGAGWAVLDHVQAGQMMLEMKAMQKR